MKSRRLAPRRARALVSLVVLGVAAAAGSLVGCDDTETIRETPPGADSGATARPDAAITPPGTDGQAPTLDGSTPDGQVPSDCFPDPKTHEEIINRCSNSERIEKTPVLKGLTADGGLPPLPT